MDRPDLGDADRWPTAGRLSPDGRELLIQKRHGDVFLMRSDGSGLHQVPPTGYEFHGSGCHNSCGVRFTPTAGG